METPSGDAAMGPEIVQAAANADPCHDHSKNFTDCFNSHEIRLGKCRDHFRLLFQCRQNQKALGAMRPSDVEEVDAEVAAPAASIGIPDSCHIPYEKLKDCLNNDEVRLGKCELYLHELFVCHMRARELWS